LIKNNLQIEKIGDYFKCFERFAPPITLCHSGRNEAQRRDPWRYTVTADHKGKT
jgi:hypothetical protein